MFAHNNADINYLRMASINARLIQYHTGLSAEQIAIVTDSQSLESYQHSIPAQIILSDITSKGNNRIYRDTHESFKTLEFKNLNRGDAYVLSPYDETLLIDADYLILSDTINRVWGHNNELMMNWEYIDISKPQRKSFLRVHPAGITMYWATMVYFKKCAVAQEFFEVVNDVKKNRVYYQMLYNWRDSLYRNDHSFSAAAHVVSGLHDKGIPQLPWHLYKTFDKDDIESAPSLRQVVLKISKTERLEFMRAVCTGIDLHVMNKWALLRTFDHMEKLLDAA